MFCPKYVHSLLILMNSDILVWNCQGAGYPNFYQTVKEYLREFNPAILI